MVSSEREWRNPDPYSPPPQSEPVRSTIVFAAGIPERIYLL